MWRDELAVAFADDRKDRWPHPIARYYLGKIDRDTLLKEAREHREHGQTRSCQALLHIGMQLKAEGDAAAAASVLEQERSSCQPVPGGGAS